MCMMSGQLTAAGTCTVSSPGPETCQLLCPGDCVGPCANYQLEVHCTIKQHRGQGTARWYRPAQADQRHPTCGALPCGARVQKLTRGTRYRRNPTAAPQLCSPSAGSQPMTLCEAAHLQRHALSLAIQAHVVEAGCGIGVVHRIGGLPQPAAAYRWPTPARTSVVMMDGSLAMLCLGWKGGDAACTG